MKLKCKVVTSRLYHYIYIGDVEIKLPKEIDRDEAITIMDKALVRLMLDRALDRADMPKLDK